MVDTSKDYNFFKERGFGESLGLDGRSCLIIIDIINGFTDVEKPLGSDLTHVINNINPFISYSRDEGFPIIFTTISYDNSDLGDKGIWFKKMKGLTTLQENSEDVKLDSRLDYQENDSILTKKYASAFFGTDLSSRLTVNNIDTVIITGATTSGCVRATAVDAIQLGFKPIVLSDCCGDRSENAHIQSIFDMEQKYADVLTSNEYIDAKSTVK